MSGLLRYLAQRAMNRAVPVRSQTAVLRSAWRREPADVEHQDFASMSHAAPAATRDAETTPQAQQKQMRPPGTAADPARDVAPPVRKHAALESTPQRAITKHLTIDVDEYAMAVLPPPVVPTAAPLHSAGRPRPRDSAVPARSVTIAPPREDTPHARPTVDIPATPVRPERTAPPSIAAVTPRKTAASDLAPIEVHVSIGRIELTALTPPAPVRSAATAPRTSRSTVPLADYLRSGAGRRP